jgi:alcohol dehydrogenase
MSITSILNLPNINYFGVNASTKVAEAAKIYNAKNALIVTDIYFLSGTGIPDIIKYNLEKAGIKATVWGGANPNPRDYNIVAGLEVFKEGHFDIIVAVGGGSSIDCAKGIRILYDNGGNIKDYEGTDKIPYRKTPLIAIATTGGTSSEADKLAVITNTEAQDKGIKYKMGLMSWRILPNVSINDPLLVASLNPYYTAGTGMDAFSHALDAIVSIDATPFSDTMGLNAISIISQWLKIAVAEGNNIEARTNMMYAVMFAGMAFNTAMLGLVHSLSHPVGTYYDLHHGTTNSVLLTAASRFVFNEAIDKLAMVAEAMHIDTSGMSAVEAANKAIAGMEQLLIDIKAPHKLSELGVGTDKIERMSIDAYNDFCAIGSPRRATVEDFKAIYESLI